MPEDIIYQAFIVSPDVYPERDIAEKLSHEIKNFKMPPKLSHQASHDLQKIYLHKASLENSDETITETTETALSQSKFLIVVCSPKTPEIVQITAIIQKFADLGKKESILTILTSGNPKKSFPALLQNGDDQTGAVQEENPAMVEPLAANICAKDLKASLKRLKETEKYRIIAPIIGCEYYDLKQRHLALQREKSIKKILFVSGVAFLLGTFYLVRLVSIYSDIKKVEVYKKLNNDIICKIYLTAPERLKDIPGADVMLQEVLWNRADIGQIIKDYQKSASTKDALPNNEFCDTQINVDSLKPVLKKIVKLKKKDLYQVTDVLSRVDFSEGIDDLNIRLFILNEWDKLKYLDDLKLASKYVGDDVVRGFEKRTFRATAMEILEGMMKWLRKINLQRVIKFLQFIK